MAHDARIFEFVGLATLAQAASASVTDLVNKNTPQYIEMFTVGREGVELSRCHFLGNKKRFV
jgi:hypothetical protein